MGNQGELEMEQRKRRRLLLFPLPLQGHINPMLQLANILYSRGFSITIIHTIFNSPNPSNYPNFAFHPIDDGLSESEASTVDVIALLTTLNVKCAVPLRDCLAGILSGYEEEETVAFLITDAVWHFSQSIADSLNLPRIVLRTSSISCFVVFTAFPLLRQKGYIPQQDSQMEEPVPELTPLRVKDIPTFKSCCPEGTEKLVNKMVNAIRASCGLIFNSLEELERSTLITLRHDLCVPIFPIGPFSKLFQASSSSLLAQDRSSISWLDQHEPKSVLYVSFGSIVSLDPVDFLEMAMGLANSGRPFLWVVRPGFVLGSGWLEGLPNGYLQALEGRGYIVKWAPQEEVLAHQAIGGFWTHCGWNSTLESICEGVPMICSPVAGDQMLNARYVSVIWRVGMMLEGKLERAAVEEAMRKLMVEKEGKEMRDRAMALKEKVDICLKQGGSSRQNMDNLVAHILSL